MQEIIEAIGINLPENLLSQNVWQWVMPFIVLFLFVLFFRIFANILRKAIEKILKKLGSDIPDDLSEALAGSLRLFILVIGIFLAIRAVPFFPSYLEAVANKISHAIVLFFVFQIIYLLVKPLGDLLKRFNWMKSEIMSNLLMKVLKVAVIFIGGISILETFGIQVAPIIAGFGLFGVAVALGAQDLFKNLIGGLLIIVEKRFDVGDWIKAEGVVEGIVEDISFRSTALRDFDRSLIEVPNSMLSSAIFVNYSRLPYWRVRMILGLEYRTTTEALRSTVAKIEEMLKADEEIVDASKAAFVIRVDKFSDSSVDVLVNCFANTKDFAEYLRIKEKVVYAIKDIVEKQGVGFAFPSQSLYIETLPREAEIKESKG